MNNNHFDDTLRLAATLKKIIKGLEGLILQCFSHKVVNREQRFLSPH